MPSRTHVLVAALGIAIATLAVYAPVVDYPFLSWDDVEYVENNPNLREPLGIDSVVRAFARKYESNWIPLTWLSLHLDAALFGIDPAVYHVENVLLHVVTSCLLLLAFARATGSVGASAFAAGVFGLHPLHVESVAWVAQRKDCLSGLFFALAIAAHLEHGRCGARRHRVATLVASAAAMLSKPTTVVLPLALLLLDVWPLGRIEPARLRATLAARIRLQLPLFAMALGAGGLTVAAQRSAGSIELLQLPLLWRVMNALWSYAAYLGATIWPSGLAFYYTWPLDGWLPWKAGLSLVLLVILSLGALAAARSDRLAPGGAGRAVAVGWAWYLVLLVPVSGLVQVGMQGRADRYMYWPLFGLALAVGFGARPVWRATRARAAVAGVAAVASLVAFAATAHVQVGYWSSGLALYQRALVATEDNFFAHWALALELIRTGRAAEAPPHFEAAIALRPRWLHPRRDYGRLLLQRGDAAAALEQLEIAVALDPRDTDARALLTRALAANAAGAPAERAPVVP